MPIILQTNYIISPWIRYVHFLSKIICRT